MPRVMSWRAIDLAEHDAKQQAADLNLLSSLKAALPDQRSARQ
jgi:hypothetical protein